MSLSISIPKTGEQIPLDGLLVLTRTAIGLGLGMLVADRIRRPIRQAKDPRAKAEEIQRSIAAVFSR